MKIKNAAGRIIETNIAEETFKPFNGAKKYGCSSKVTSLSDALMKSGLRNR